MNIGDTVRVTQWVYSSCPVGTLGTVVSMDGYVGVKFSNANSTVFFESGELELAKGRVTLTVEVTLDPTPGTFHTAESARDQVARILNSHLTHYVPVVKVQS